MKKSSARESAEVDGRVGRRRLHTAPLGDPTQRDPSRIVPVKGKHAYPGEQAPLAGKPGRTDPITEQEALGVLRRRRRADLAQKYAELSARQLAKAGLPPTLEEALPSQLPSWTVAKKPVTLRLSPRLRALIDARAEWEGSNFSAVVEEALFRLSQQPPRDPDTARAQQREFLRDTVGRDRLDEEFRR